MNRRDVLSTSAAAALLALLEPPHPSEAAEEGKPAENLDPCLKKLGELVGGKWQTKFKKPDGSPFGEIRFTWSPDGYAVHSNGVLGMGTPRPVHVHARLGWDPTAKQVYYLDMHGTGTVYFGTVKLVGEELHYSFKSLVGKPAEYVLMERQTDPDTWVSELQRVVDGKPEGRVEKITLLRVR